MKILNQWIKVDVPTKGDWWKYRYRNGKLFWTFMLKSALRTLRLHLLFTYWEFHLGDNQNTVRHCRLDRFPRLATFLRKLLRKI